MYIADSDISTEKDTSGGIHAAGGGTLYAWNLNVGTAGANGSDCTFTADDQDMEGAVIWDSLSQLDFYMTNGSTLTGYFADDETFRRF